VETPAAHRTLENVGVDELLDDLADVHVPVLAVAGERRVKAIVCTLALDEHVRGISVGATNP